MPWELTGNANINESTEFLGTTDRHSLVIRTTNTERLRIDEMGRIGVGTTTPTDKLQVSDGVYSFSVSEPGGRKS
jgi:hypothetical protein